MTNEKLYDSIFHRKSIRKYILEALPEDTLNKIMDFVSKAKPIDDTIKYQFHYIKTNDVKNIMPIKAPHYICLYSEKKDGYLMNAGFILQQVDLFLSANNIGSCWLGMAKPNKEVPVTQNGLEFVIMLAFGNTTEPVHRNDLSQFSRRNISEITSIVGAEELLEPVRLAPSASNTQPWFFSGSVDEIIVSREKLNIVKAAMYGKMNQIDIGIALFHLILSIEAQGKQAKFDYEKVESPKGYDFMVKVTRRNNVI